MINIFDDIFSRAAQEAGIEQHPNWAGAVWGSCQTEGCPNHRVVGEYVRGFCKKCSTRNRKDRNLPVISRVTRNKVEVDAPNPRIEWKKFRWVKDMSYTMTPTQKRDFYDRPPGHMG